MKSQSLSRLLKSPWSFAVVAVAVLAFLAAALIFNRGVADEPPPVTPSGSPTPARSSGWGPAYSGVKITLSGGRTLELPSDVYIAGITDNVFCYTGDNAPPCSRTPLYMLKKGDSVVEIDSDGNIEGDGSLFRPSDFTGVLGEFISIDGNDVWDPAAFPFLPEFQGD